MNWRWPLFLLFFAPALIVNAQEPAADTIPPATVRDTLPVKIFTKYFSEDLVQYYPDSLQDLDTSISLAHRFEPALYLENFTRNTGNFGSPAHPLFYVSPQNPGFRTGINQYNIYNRQAQNVRFYATATPYTFLGYSQGAATGSLQLQKVEVLHTRNFSPQGNFGIRYHRFNSPGYYFREGNLHTNGEIFTHYRTKNQRYRVMASGVINRHRSEEYGGIADPAGFDTITGLARVRTPVNLQEAAQVIGNQNLRVSQFYYLGPYKEVKQRPEDTFVVRKLQPQWQLSHSINYNRQTYEYLDGAPDTAFYRNFYFDSTRTQDSLLVKILENEFRVATSPHNPIIKYKQFVPYLAFFARHRYIYAGQAVQQNRQNEIITGAELQNDKGIFHFGGKGEYLVHGLNNGNYNLSGWAGINIKGIVTGGGLEVKKYDAAHIFRNYLSNHHIWQENFSPINEQAIKFFSRSNRYRFNAEGEVRRIDNFVYVSSNLQPQQHTAPLNYLRMRVRKDFTWRSLNLAMHLMYQAADNDTLLPFPQFAAKTTFFWQGAMFNNALFAQAGFDVDFASAYTGTGYYPTLGVENVQQTEQVEGYPLVNFFVNAKIKTFTAFVALGHANQGFSGTRYFSYPLYPLAPRNLRFGITWRFYN